MLEKFLSLLDRHGGRIETWPESEAATAFAARDPNAAQALEQARRLERALDSWQAPDPPPGLRGRLASIPAMEDAPRTPAWMAALGALLGGTGWRAAGGMAFALAAGVTLGLSSFGTDTLPLTLADPVASIESEVEAFALDLIEENQT